MHYEKKLRFNYLNRTQIKNLSLLKSAIYYFHHTDAYNTFYNI